MRRRFFVEVSEKAFDKLIELEIEQRRDVRDQAGVLLEQAVAQRLTNFQSAPAELREATPA